MAPFSSTEFKLQFSDETHETREDEGACWPQSQLGAALGHGFPGLLLFLLLGLIFLLLTMTLDNLLMGGNRHIGEPI